MLFIAIDFSIELIYNKKRGIIKKNHPNQKNQINIDGITAKKAKLSHYRIDNEYSNSYEVWKKMGSPQTPTDAQYKQLEAAGQLTLLDSPKNVAIKKGKLNMNFALPRQGVSLVKLDW